MKPLFLGSTESGKFAEQTFILLKKKKKQQRYCIITKVNELHEAGALNGRKGTAEGTGGGRDTYRELLPFFSVRCGQEAPCSW